MRTSIPDIEAELPDISELPSDTPQLINERQVCDILGCSASYLATLVRRGAFPAPIKLGYKFKRWPLNVVLGFIFERLADAKRTAA